MGIVTIRIITRLISVPQMAAIWGNSGPWGSRDGIHEAEPGLAD